MPQPSDASVWIEDRWFKDFGRGTALVGTKCLDCDRVFFPPKPVCPKCFDGRLEETPLNTRGTLHAFARSVMGPTDMKKPFVMGFVDLPEGIKLYSLIVDCEPWDQVLRVGMDVEMVVGPVKTDSEGRDVIGYMFRPVKEETDQ